MAQKRVVLICGDYAEDHEKQSPTSLFFPSPQTWPRIWVCVGEDFDIKQLMIKIIRSAIGMECKDKNKEELHKVVLECLNGKRFVVVLDDVWNDDDKKRWVELKDLLFVGAQGSKIVVTTRSHKVAAITGTVPRYDLEHLSDEKCLSLFLNLAFNEGEEKQHKNLVRIGGEIVSKCRGVALAVKTLGSMLCSTRVQHDWELVRDSEIWKLEQKGNGILPALKLSYDHLPWYLKQCFVFCSVFPKDHEFFSLELIAMWMANGFLQFSNKNEEPEDIGNRYIHELCSRSFFQQSEDVGFYVSFKLHDLVHDLALSVAQNGVNSFNHYWAGNDLDLSGQAASGCMRSLMFRSKGKHKPAVCKSLLVEHISRSNRLRVLDMKGCNFERFPNNICCLKHLRYLKILDNCNIKELPNSICGLQSLETLDFSGCEGIEELPKDIRYLIKLRYLAVTTKQTSLEESGIRCLKTLHTLIIFGCINLISLPQGLKYLTAMETLVIGDCEKLDLSVESELGGENEDGSLRSLVIASLPKLESLPQWIVLGSTKTLHHLYINNLENLLTLPTWFRHLSSIEKLRIGDCPKLSSLPEGMQHLTTLEDLVIEGCPELGKRCIEETGEDWSKIAHVPQLYISNNLETSTSDDDDDVM